MTSFDDQMSTYLLVQFKYIDFAGMSWGPAISLNTYASVHGKSLSSSLILCAEAAALHRRDHESDK